MNRIFFLFAVALLLPLRSLGCWHPTYKPQDYITYRLYDHNNEGEGGRGINCKQWQIVASCDIPLNDIEAVVYEWTPEELSSLKGSKNKFAQWLSKNRDAWDYLMLAKSNEGIRDTFNDPWYYPCPDDEEHQTLRGIVRNSKSVRQGYLKDRYALQLVRALRAMGRCEEIIDFWNKTKIDNALIKQMIYGYVGGAYYAMGQYDKALPIFGKTNDVGSTMLCLKAKGEPADILTVIQSMKENGACNESVVRELNGYVINDIENSYCDSARQARLKRLVKVVRHIYSLEEKDNRAMWKYTEAYCYWMQEKMNACRKAIRQAESLPSSKFLSQSIHILRLLVEAKTLPLNDNYDIFLYSASKWLLRQANAEKPLFDELTKERLHHYEPGSPYVIQECYERIITDRNLNYSDFYFADMFRKIMIGQAAPRLIKAGKTLRALQIVDMGDNIMLPDSAIRIMNNHGGATFAMADTLDVDAVIQFTNHMRYPQNRYDKFYGKHGSRCNMDFWYDLVGTILLRKGRYEAALSWLKKVDSDYYDNEHTYIREYFEKDPFAVELINGENYRGKEVLVNDKKNYKLNFAKKMVRLRHTYLHAKGRNKRAYAKFQFAVGMHNSVYPCWALTHHYWGGSPLYVNEDIGDKVTKYDNGYCWDYKDVRRHQSEINYLMWTSARLMKQSLREMTDKELLARLHWKLGNYRTVKHRLGNTQFAMEKRGQCDRWKDY